MTADNQHEATAEFNEALQAAFDAGTFEDLAAFYTEASIVLPPRGRILEGRGSAGAFWRGVKNRFAAVRFTTASLKAIGEETRRETGTYVMTPGDGEGAEIEGKYLFVWQRVGDEWQIESSIWNRNTGAAGQQGAGQGQGGQRGRAGQPGQGGRRPGAGQGGGQGQRGGPGGGYGGGGNRQGGGRPSFQGGQGAGGRRPGGGAQGGARPYEDQGGLYSDLKE